MLTGAWGILESISQRTQLSSGTTKYFLGSFTRRHLSGSDVCFCLVRGQCGAAREHSGVSPCPCSWWWLAGLIPSRNSNTTLSSSVPSQGCPQHATLLRPHYVSSRMHWSLPSQERILPSQLILQLRKVFCPTEMYLLHTAVTGATQGWWHNLSQPGEKGCVQFLWGSVDLRSQPGLRLHHKCQATSVHPLPAAGLSRDRLCWTA